jgi:hypothetical protein
VLSAGVKSKVAASQVQAWVVNLHTVKCQEALEDMVEAVARTLDLNGLNLLAGILVAMVLEATRAKQTCQLVKLMLASMPQRFWLG